MQPSESISSPAPLRTRPSRVRTDEELFEAIRAGSQEAWEQFVGRYAELALSVARRTGLSEADAEDVCQATWSILYEHVQLIRKPGSISAWITTTATWESRKLLRLKSRWRSLDGEEKALRSTDPAPLPDESAEGEERVQLLREAIGRLHPNCRRLLEQLYFSSGDRGYEHICGALGMPHGSIGPTRVRCLAKLARILEQKGLQ